jgi:thiosulfate dehydrogenase
MRFLLGFIFGALILVGCGFGAAYCGLLPAAANDPSMRFEPLIANAGLAARIKSQAPNRDVSTMSTADLVAGAGLYQKNCAVCHALPGQPQDAVGAGMFPQAPQLFSPDGMVTDDSAGETFWKVKNGIRLSGMPSFGAALSEDQMWQITAVVKRADKLPQEALDALKPQPAVVAPATTTSAPVPILRKAKP